MCRQYKKSPKNIELLDELLTQVVAPILKPKKDNGTT